MPPGQFSPFPFPLRDTPPEAVQRDDDPFYSRHPASLTRPFCNFHSLWNQKFEWYSRSNRQTERQTRASCLLPSPEKKRRWRTLLKKSYRYLRGAARVSPGAKSTAEETPCIYRRIRPSLRASFRLAANFEMASESPVFIAFGSPEYAGEPKHARDKKSLAHYGRSRIPLKSSRSGVCPAPDKSSSKSREFFAFEVFDPGSSASHRRRRILCHLFSSFL